MDAIAGSYVKLVLAVGEHDADYVDAYYGPAEVREEVRGSRPALADLKGQAESLLAALGAPPDGGDEMLRLRHEFLVRQLQAVHARLEMLLGRRFSFDEESLALYGAVAPSHPEAYFAEQIARLDRLLPGAGPVPERYQAWRAGFAVPRERLPAVFGAAVEEARARTLRHVPLPDEESFRIEYVTDRPWSGYNWYQGGLASLIQVNTQLPVYVDRALDLAAHEGYPGHHVYNALLEHELVRGRGWVELTVYPLFSPQSLVAEGSANHGIEMAFPGGERLAYERDVLFPLAGLDPARAAEFHEVMDVAERVAYAGNEAARAYLDGRWTRDETAHWLAEFALMSLPAATQRTRFFDAYRSYVVNYTLGQDLVRAWVERAAGPGADAAARWRVFRGLLASPRVDVSAPAPAGA